MREGPGWGVSTVLVNLVGRSVVSAITQTPASGPFALATTPLRSFAPMEAAESLPCGAVCWQAAKSELTSTAARREPVFIFSSLRKSTLLPILRPDPPAQHHPPRFAVVASEL